ncbi:MAG: hypothetical protein HYZ27_02550, partial [Deltaproteobacteria bacterium]|nr:hypothetical protein [Deltaproteobacteria bacterium]
MAIGEHATASQVVEDLVAAAAAGDASARRELFAHYWPMIRHVVRACRARAGAARAADDTDDVAQEVAIALLQSLPKQRWQGRQAFRGWLKKLAAARVVDAQRYHLAQRRDRRAEAVLEPALMA